MIKNPYKEVILELKKGLWEHNIRVQEGIAEPYEYDDETFRACLKIFTESLVHKFFYSGKKITKDSATECGNHLRNFIIDYTGIDPHEL